MSDCKSRWSRRSGGGGGVWNGVHEMNLAGWSSAWCGGDGRVGHECGGDGGDDGIDVGYSMLATGLVTGCDGCWRWRSGELVVALEVVRLEEHPMYWKLQLSKVVAGVKEERRKFAQCQGGLLVLRVLWRLTIGGLEWSWLVVMLVLQ